MSAKVSGMVFDRYPVGGGEMLLALAIADHAHDDGTHIFPSVSHLSAKTRQSERTVQYQLRRMEEGGWLILVNAGTGGRQAGYGEGGKTREYRISPDWIKGANFAPFENSHVEGEKGATAIAPLEAPKGATDDLKGCKTAHERVQNGVEKGATAIAPEPRATINKATKSNHHSARERAQRPSIRFDEFWLAYPVKTAKPQCLRKWKASKLDALADVILADIAVKRVSDRRWLDGYIPNPHTYLNQERWNDPVQPVARGGPVDGSSAYPNQSPPQPGIVHATPQSRESLVDRAARKLEEIGVLHQ